METLGLVLAALIGISLGLLGGGGSILAVPILVYVVGMAAKPAIATSLLVVSTASLVGSFRHFRPSNVDLRTALVFGLVSMAGSYAGGKLAAHLSDTFQLMLFAAVMLAASVSMFRSQSDESRAAATVLLPLVVSVAAVVGLLTGIVGVGGGFLIVPALVLFAGLPMKRAVGTSLDEQRRVQAGSEIFLPDCFPIRLIEREELSVVIAEKHSIVVRRRRLQSGK